MTINDAGVEQSPEPIELGAIEVGAGLEINYSNGSGMVHTPTKDPTPRAKEIYTRTSHPYNNKITLSYQQQSEPST